MTTRGGTTYNTMGSRPPSPNNDVEPNAILNAVTTLTEKIDTIVAHIDRLEQPNEEQRDEHRAFHRGPQGPRFDRDVVPYERDPDEKIMRSVRVDAPSYDGELNPAKFLDWMAKMDHYFE